MMVFPTDFIVVTMTTVGYGDVVTVSVMGKFIVTVMIILSPTAASAPVRQNLPKTVSMGTALVFQNLCLERLCIKGR